MNPVSANKYLIVIAGPTAVGKSDVALQLAQHFDTEILSADARQCFREMNIGTAKPDEAALRLVKHHFINSHSIFDSISAGQYEQYALDTLDTIFKSRNVAVVCGGTGLYIKALLHGMDHMPPVDPAIEKETLSQYEISGFDWLKEQLSSLDHEYAHSGQMMNPSRMLRALIFYKSNGQSILAFQKGTRQSRYFHAIGIGLELPRKELYERIDIRVDKMIEAGLYDEAVSLYPHRHLKNLLTVGYQEFYSGGRLPDTLKALGDAVEKIKQHSRNYAKRQMTWFKNKEDFSWFAPTDWQAILKHCESKVNS